MAAEWASAEADSIGKFCRVPGATVNRAARPESPILRAFLRIAGDRAARHRGC